jgi:hypothetical protein
MNALHAAIEPGPAGRFPMIRRLAVACVVMLQLPGIVCATGAAEDPQIGARRDAERKTFTDAEITDGFLKVALGAEFHTGASTDRIRKYDGPVRVYIDNRAKHDRRADIAGVVADIRKRIEHLDIATTEDRGAANVVVTLVRDRDLGRTLRGFYGRTRAEQIRRSLDPQCLSGFRRDESYRILHSDVIIVVDKGDFILYDCAYEEMLQALGPINDNRTVPWTMFNDAVQMGFFDVYDQYLLNILYDPRVRPGMNAEEVRAVLPLVLPTVRGWVQDINHLTN